MDFLKTVWPTPFKIKEKDVTSFVVQLIIFIVLCAIAGVVFSILGMIPIVGWLVGIVGGLLGLYSFVGIVLCILQFLGMLK